jgi:hypothetical protein
VDTDGRQIQGTETRIEAGKPRCSKTSKLAATTVIVRVRNQFSCNLLVVGKIFTEDRSCRDNEILNDYVINYVRYENLLYLS